jgi:hypothetical protein
LHGFGRGQRDGLRIDVEVGVVADGAGAAITLGDHAQRTESEEGFVEEQVRRQHRPVALADHADKLLTKKIHMVFGGLVGAPQ